MWMEYLPHENSISEPLVELSHTLILPGALIVHQAYNPCRPPAKDVACET